MSGASPAGSLRGRMPRVAAFVDALRAVGWGPDVDAALRNAKAGGTDFWASEGGSGRHGFLGQRRRHGVRRAPGGCRGQFLGGSVAGCWRAIIVQGQGLNELALFAGAGGGILGGKLLGWRTVCAVECEPYAASVLVARQNDGFLPPFPIWDDVCTFDGRPWQGIAQVVSGGFPCQDISAAGKGAGIDGERSGLWGQMARIIGEVRPQYVCVENSPLLVGRGLARVLADLAEMGFDARWGVVGACDVGAPHRRERIWIVAHAERNAGHKRPWLSMQRGWQEETKQTGMGCCAADVAHADKHARNERREGDASQKPGGRDIDRGTEQPHAVAHTDRERQQEQHASAVTSPSRQHPGSPVEIRTGSWWSTEPDVGRVADGVAARVDRLKAIGNGQVPAVAAAAWEMLTNSEA